MRVWPLFCLATMVLAGCGYHEVGGRSDTLPKGIQTIAVQPFASNADQYNLSDQLAGAIADEFTTSTRYRVVNSRSEPDAILTGSIGSVSAYPTISDPKTGRATSVGLTVTLSVTLTQRTTGKILYAHRNFSVRDNYEIATDPHQTFIESGPALQRISRTVARDVVASILDDF